MAPFPTLLHRVGRRIRELRKAHDWSQEKLAHDAEISRTYMGTIEIGTKQPTLWTLFKIAKALGVPLSELFLLPREEEPEAADIAARVHARLLDKGRTLSELRKAEALIDALLRKGR